VSVATPQQLADAAADLGVPLPDSDEWTTGSPPHNTGLERLLDRAQADVEVLACRTRFTTEDLAALDDLQEGALAAAVCVQALWLAELADAGDAIGPSDIEGLPGGVTFSRELRPSLSPRALELVALTGLIARSGTALPDPAPVIPERPWWLWL
jgi:hypothetical protein